MKLKTPLEMLNHWADTQPDAIFLHQPCKENEWENISWKESQQIVQNIATAIQNLNLEPGSRIAILGNNSAYWVLCDLGIMLAGMVSVPLYAQQNPDSLKYILTHCDAKLIFIGALEHSESLIKPIPSKIQTVAMPCTNVSNCIYNWHEFIDNQQPIELSNKLEADMLATIMYTSGTTGKPKGVMHSINTISFTASNLVKDLSYTNKDTFFSYLPLCHAAERFLMEHLCLYCGGSIYFNQSIKTFANRLKLARPSSFIAVPRIWHKLQEAILTKSPPNFTEILNQYTPNAEMIKQMIRKEIGLDNIRLTVSGAAAISTDILTWFHKLGIPIAEGYGLTENCSYSTLNRPERNQIGTVGEVFPETIIKISDNQEILIKNPATMQGYYLDPDETKKVITDDGFLCTGDMGTFENGYLTIIGRIKDLFKTAKGKYIAPTPIENKLTSNPLIAQICLVGAGLIQPIALISLSEIATNKTINEIEHNLNDLLLTINDTLENHEKIAKLVICDTAWTVENELITPTQKIKRHAIENYYCDIIQLAEQQNSTIIWELNIKQANKHEKNQSSLSESPL